MIKSKTSEAASAKVLFMGIDCGGSKSDCMIACSDGEILSYGSHREPGASGRSVRVVGESVRAAFATIPESTRVFNLCLTGTSKLFVRKRGRIPPNTVGCPHLTLSPKIFPDGMISHADVISEEAAALALHGLNEGIVVLGGTGAFVHVEMPSEGVVLHYDGLGPMLGDHGSAYQIGLAALRAAAAAHWSPRRATSLRKAVFETLRLASVGDAIALSLRKLDRSLLASLVPIVEAEAIKGDGVAYAILHEAADALAETLYDALATGRLFNTDAALVGTGGLATRCAIYWDRVCERARAMAPGLRPVINPRPAVLGTLVHGLALRQGIQGVEKKELANRLIRSYDDKFENNNKRKTEHV